MGHRQAAKEPLTNRPYGLDLRVPQSRSLTMSRLSYSHPEGPGLKILDRSSVWYGGGYCGICGSRSDDELVPQAVRFWDPDDGWKVGVLCTYCGEEAAARGPRHDDYACLTEDGATQGGTDIQRLRRDPSILAEYIDLDAQLSAGDLDHMLE